MRAEYFSLGFRSIDHQHILDRIRTWIRSMSTSALRIIIRIWELSVVAIRLGPDVSICSSHTSPMHAGQSGSTIASQSSSVIAVGDGRPMRQRRHLMSHTLIIISRTMRSMTMRPCGYRSDHSVISLGVITTSSEPRRTSAGHLVVIVVNEKQSRYEKEKTIFASAQHLARIDEPKLTTQAPQTLSRQSRSYKPAYTSDTHRPEP